jgi:hypothetical protein
MKITSLKTKAVREIILFGPNRDEGSGKFRIFYAVEFLYVAHRLQAIPYCYGSESKELDTNQRVTRMQ